MSPYSLVVGIALLAICAGAGAIGGSEYPCLWDSHDETLQSALESALRKQVGADYWQSVKEGRAGVVVVDVTDKRSPKVAGFNPDRMMYAASLPKIAILLGAFVQIERGAMTLDDDTRVSLTRMIRRSSNTDATANLERVGFENLAEILQSDKYRLYDREHNGGLWVGRDYAGGPVWKRDPLHSISHGATAMQAARFFYLAITGRLVPAHLEEEFKTILSAPAIEHKFVLGLETANPDAVIYRKSGTWKHYHADSGLVVDEDYRYIVVALAQSPKGAKGLVRFVRAVDEAIKTQHDAESPSSTELKVPN